MFPSSESSINGLADIHVTSAHAYLYGHVRSRLVHSRVISLEFKRWFLDLRLWLAYCNVIVAKAHNTRKRSVAAVRWIDLAIRIRTLGPHIGYFDTCFFASSQFFAIADTDSAALLFIGNGNMWGRLSHA